MSSKGYAPVNGLKMYYEIHGSGQPLVLLHGGAGATEMFSEVLRPLSEGRQVVAADLQAHGRTADIDRPLRYELMADDVAALISTPATRASSAVGCSRNSRNRSVARSRLDRGAR